MMNGLSNGFGGGMGMGYMWYMWLIPIAVVVALVYLFHSGGDGETSSAQEILDKRYASGGISEEEYLTKSEHLRQQRAAS